MSLTTGSRYDHHPFSLSLSVLNVVFDRCLVRTTGDNFAGRGLLGGHVLAVYFREKAIGLQWYNNELLSRAKELGDRLLPAFNTTTGIPYPKVKGTCLCYGIDQH